MMCLILRTKYPWWNWVLQRGESLPHPLRNLFMLFNDSDFFFLSSNNCIWCISKGLKQHKYISPNP